MFIHAKPSNGFPLHLESNPNLYNYLQGPTEATTTLSPFSESSPIFAPFLTMHHLH